MTPESERETRKRRIDPQLKAAGWKVVPFSSDPWLPSYGNAAAVEEFETGAGPADYALLDDGMIIGVAEAKKLTVGPQGVLTQAERYSRGLHQEPRHQGEFGVPFLYSTNGERILFHDVRRELNRSRDVSAFHAPGALLEMLGRDFDTDLAKLRPLPMHGGMRPYQVEASEAIEEAVAHGDRKLLVTMATQDTEGASSKTCRGRILVRRGRCSRARGETT